MIEQLTVKNYILFEKGQIDFRKNMSVITGETGAGKSLLIDAIGYLSGDRLQGNVVRHGADKAILQMVLSELPEQALDLLEENGFDTDEDEFIITRTIQSTGKSRLSINGQAVTNAFIKKLMALIVDVHSQMDTITLNDPVIQLDLLDQYANTLTLREKVKEAYKAWSKISSELKKLQNETFSDEELEFTTAQLNEIDAANLKEGELEELSEKIKDASHAQRDLDALSSGVYLLGRDGGVQDQLAECWKTLKNSDAVSDLAERVHSLYYEAMDIRELLQEKKETLQNGAEQLDAMQEREYELKKLYRRNGGSYQSTMEKRERLQEKIDRILHRQDLFDKLEKEKKQALKAYMALAKELSDKRMVVRDELKAKVEANAHDLMLEHAVFEIVRKEKAPSDDGIDELEFMVSMNPGQDLSPLKTSASGGELSRLMLALKVVFQASNGIGTLVFDEIDTGVSGKVALAMGSKMHDLSQNYQVLAITHLPSVAVWADDHYRVSKHSENNSTSTTIELLDEEQHLQELAIMASGSAGDKAVESMREMAAKVRHG